MFKKSLLVLSQVVLILGLQSGVAYGTDCSTMCKKVWIGEKDLLAKHNVHESHFAGVCAEDCRKGRDQVKMPHQACPSICSALNRTLDVNNKTFNTNCNSTCVKES